MTQLSPFHRLRFLAALMLLSAAVMPAWAESEVCEEELTQAEGLYEVGRFGAALSLLDSCFERRPTRTLRIRMLSLEAKIHIARDDRQAAAAAVMAVLELESSFTPDPRDPPRYLSLVAELQQGESVRTVSSVSKVAESQREAPASVTVITAEQLERRGYIDLEEVLHDLPGIDISRTNGAFYANVYQRGFRSDLTERTLLLIDGVEENSLSVGAVYLSRQYPLSNIQQIEVIYGPASTIYGANAFAGVINIITKQPRDRLAARQQRGDRSAVGVDLEAFSGSRSTEGGEITAFGQLGSLSWSVTGRYFASDELDRSGFENWDYDPSYFENPSVPYRDLLRLSTPQDASSFKTFLAETGLVDCDGGLECPYRFVRNPAGQIVGTELTDAGAALATRLDQAVYGELLNGNPIAYSDPTEDWLVTGKLQLPNLTFGFQTWRRDEGAAGWYTDRAAPGADNFHRWVPEQNWLYLDYHRDLTPTVSLRLFGRFKEHETTGDTALSFFSTYDRGRLDLRALVQEIPASAATRFFFESSNELRGEATVIYQPSKRFSLVTGVELRNNAIARDFVLSAEADPSQTGNPSTPDGQGTNRLNGRDYGIYSQASYRLRDNLKIVLAGRLDYNEVRESLGFGSVFNPRLAVVYSPRDWVLKAMYSTAFQDASNIQRFGTNRGVRVGNPDLDPEDVDNFELGANWQPNEGLFFEAAVYESRYSGVVQSTGVACAGLRPELRQFCVPGQSRIAQFQNLGNLEVLGAQLAGSAELSERVSVYGNYTYTDPRNIAPVDSNGEPLVDRNGRVINEQRVGDIASHQLNLGVNTVVTDKLNANLRINYVGTRPTGAGTTVPGNPFSQIDSNFVAHLAVTYKGLLRGSSLQLVINNLLDEEYFDPGLREASETLYAPRAPQPGRNAFMRFRTAF